MAGELIVVSWETASAVIAISIPFLAFLRVIIRDMLNKKQNEKPHETSLEEDIKTTKDDLARIETGLNKLELNLANTAYDEKIKSINLQITDLKEVMARFQDRLEKMSDLNIKILNRNGDN